MWLRIRSLLALLESAPRVKLLVLRRAVCGRAEGLARSPPAFFETDHELEREAATCSWRGRRIYSTRGRGERDECFASDQSEALHQSQACAFGVCYFLPSAAARVQKRVLKKRDGANEEMISKDSALRAYRRANAPEISSLRIF